MISQIDLRGQPNAVNLMHESRKFFEAAQEPAAFEVQLDQAERTVDGFIELGWDHLQLQRALHLDFSFEMSNLSREELEAQAQTHLDSINAQRAKIGIEQSGADGANYEVFGLDTVQRGVHAHRAKVGSEPLDIHTISTTLLEGWIEPRWLDVAQSEEYETLSSSYPDHMKANLNELRDVDAKLRILSEDDALRASALEVSHTENEAIKAATGWLRTDTKIEQAAMKISHLYQAAASSGRPLTKADLKHIKRLQALQVDLRTTQGTVITSLEIVKPTGRHIERLVRRKRRREFESGLVRTDSMKETIAQALPSLSRGNPVLFVGETGGAKTALAESIAAVHMLKKAEFISGYSDVNGYQLMGKTGLNSKDGASVTEFIAGPVVRAMENGVPLILDEINAMPAEFLKRLNKILQLRPGDTMTIQEDSGREITVRSGFCIIATMNEKSKRHKGVEDLSAELLNRFAASTYRIPYPDHDTANGQVPKENLMLAVAALTDEVGEFAVELPGTQLEDFVRAAHITQKLYSGSMMTGDEKTLYLDTSRRVDAEGLEMSVLAPRTMVAILEEVRASYGTIQLPTILKRWLGGVKSANDRAVITKVLDFNGKLLDNIK